ERSNRRCSLSKVNFQDFELESKREDTENQGLHFVFKLQKAVLLPVVVTVVGQGQRPSELRNVRRAMSGELRCQGF
ncbi:hypothetical protein AAMO2058_000807000, partial [Amorphochlora amoebiformis]